MNNSGTFTKLSPLSLLRQLSNCSESTGLQAFSNSVSWSIYLDQGKITYATDSVEPFDRLERHLRRLSRQIPLLKSETRVQLRLMFESDSHGKLKQLYDLANQPPDYQAICWLVSQKYLNSAQAGVLIQELVKEVIESLLLIKQGSYNLTDTYLPKICNQDVEKVIECCQERLQNWHSLAPQISSPFQRPYLCVSTRTKPEKLLELQPNLIHWMKGFSLRHLAVIINQDELKLAQTLHPYILHGALLLHEPDPPFDKLPKTCEELSAHSDIAELADIIAPSSITTKEKPSIADNRDTPLRLPDISSPLRDNYQQLATNKTNTATLTERKVHKIVSVDDSPTMLKEITRLLEDENFFVVTIIDPLKAVMSIVRHKPDLILLDLNMAGIDGYELCRLIRNNSMFKETPIIFVTGSKGIIDKIKAKMVGASGYLTKPFSRSELLKMVFMHLS
ncbi:response regulator receiver protein [Tolypothrix sp. NIES-4075]|uniref:response regulator n=1 Tax=Tolypothrix sp. NIES-4075 TaxID=2005459 RepID=UPI000B5C3D33|nr:response regulator [Tolypothrix sp. NIES-4075]GAX44587.1 response regulator receiver protein [Tolypothrix sp. NIES-4075]